MRPTRVVGAAAVMVSVLLVSGCGGGSGGDDAAGSPTATATASGVRGIASGEPAPPQTSTSAPAPSSSTPSSKGTAAGAPGVPDAARQHTKAGAVAFARYYMGLINSAGQHPKVGVLEPLALSRCKSCDNYEGTVSAFVKDHQRFDGPQYDILSATITGYSEIATFVKISASEPAVNIVDSNGTTVKSYKKIDDSTSVYELSWKNGWRVATIKGE